MEKVYDFNSIPVMNVIGETSDHKILVVNYDNKPDYLLNKISQKSLIKLVEDNDEEGKFKFVVNSYDQGGDESVKGEIYRCVPTFSMTQIDAHYTNLHINDREANLLVFPITIALGEIRSFGVYFENREDILTLDRAEIAIVSNTVNNIAGSKVEFFAGYYGFNNPQNTCKPGDDFKTFIIHTKEDLINDPNIVVSDYNGIYDTHMNYHYVVMYIHSNSDSTRLLAKNISSKLKEVGKNMNYCGRYENKESIFLNSGIIDKNSMTISESCDLQNNMGSPIPYLEFYQLRNLGLNGDLKNGSDNP